MANEEKLMFRAIVLIKARGENALEQAQQAMSQEKTGYELLDEALNYFMNEAWRDFMHPALLSLACESVGGNPEETVQVGAAFVLLAGGADIHDDVIDQSKIKVSKPTVFGKFGKDIAILAGDVLLFKGLYLLHDAMSTLQDDKRTQILESLRHAFLNISRAEAKEASFKGNRNPSWQEYFDIVKMKASVAKATTTIGAILGNATVEEIKILSDFGETLGILSTVRDEIIDVFETNELRNRAENECLPLPILLAFEDSEVKEKILSVLKEPLNNERIEKILELAVDSKQTRMFLERMQVLMEHTLEQTAKLEKCYLQLTLLLRAFMEDI